MKFNFVCWLDPIAGIQERAREEKEKEKAAAMVATAATEVMAATGATAVNLFSRLFRVS